MKIWRGERIRVESDDSHNHNLSGLPGAFWGMARKVITPRLMRTEAVLVLRYSIVLSVFSELIQAQRLADSKIYIAFRMAFIFLIYRHVYVHINSVFS